MCCLQVLIVAAFALAASVNADRFPDTFQFPNDPPQAAVLRPKIVPVDPNEMKMQKVIARGVTKVALELERVMGNGEHNTVFSPLSVTGALALLLLGAKGNSSSEIANFLGVITEYDIQSRKDLVHVGLGRYFTAIESNLGDILGTHLTYASGVFVQEGYNVNPNYVKDALETYRSEVYHVNFAYHSENATTLINNWVSNRTHGEINSLIQGTLSQDTRAVLANALYFNGLWEHPFTAKRDWMKFKVSKTEFVNIPYMATVASLPYVKDKAAGYRMVGFPYKGGDMIMYVVLPYGDLKTFLNTLSVDKLENMINSTTPQCVICVMPSLEVEERSNLVEPLYKLGIKSVFNAARADLSGLAQGVYVNSVVHQAKVQINEKGTTASAATGITLNRGGFEPIFRVDKPFLFFIYYKPTESITFWGTIYKPSPPSPLKN